MKRRRNNAPSTDGAASKRAKINHDATLQATTPLLRQFYTQVLTLRQYLAARLAKHSKKRRRKVLQCGVRHDGSKGDLAEQAVVRLLDTTVVGVLNGIHNLDMVTVENDITVFTQQISDSTITIGPTQGSLKQSEIVDFVIWQLFRRAPGSRRPAHVLCHGFQRTANNNADLEIVPGIPGIYSVCYNTHVQTLREQPWTALPDLLGSGAERIMSDLLLDCGLYVPVGDSNNLKQLSGTPMCELKACQVQRSNRPEIGHTGHTAGTNRSPRVIGLSGIRFVRHRMLYARPSLTVKGRPHFGLARGHVLDRMRNADEVEGTMHVLKYIFPRQFGLHNVFTSHVDTKDTTQSFQDYTDRDDDIARRKPSARQRPDLSAKPSHLPKRLRGEAFNIVHRIRKRHARCPYHALLQAYCPPQQMEDARAQGSVRHASPAAKVSAYCRAAIMNVFPSEIWGSGATGRANRSLVLLCVDRFVRLRRYETLSLHDVLQHLKVHDVKWLTTPNTNRPTKLSNTDYTKRKELMAELLYYLFDSYLIPLIRGSFHVTESNVHRNQLFYFRHDVWQAMSEPALSSLKRTMLEECSATTVKKMLATRALGVSQVRLLPKEQGMRPIINLRRRVQKLQYGSVVLGRSINSILTPAFSVLNCEKNKRPQVLGSALFSVDDIFPRLQAFRQSLCEQGLEATPLFFAKVDVQACFDTIPQKRLMALVKTILSADKYSVARYSRAKLLGGQSKETPGFGAKASWKFLTKATPENEAFSFERETETDTSGGRTRTVYVDGVIQKSEKRAAILGLIEEHIERNLIKVGNRFYRQKEGIPQGSIVSSLLCSYMYAELEREVLGFLGDGQSTLLRLIDDFLVISTNQTVAERFMQVMHDGIPEFGVRVKAEKSRANFDIVIEGKRIPRLPQSSEFPYCGNAINTVTLDLSKDHERRRKGSLVDSVTVEYSRLPGQTFYRKTLNVLKLQMHAMLLATSYNSMQTVLSNLYHSFFEVAQKSYFYVRSLPDDQQPGDELAIKAIDDMIQLACVLMKRRSKRPSKDGQAYECAVSSVQARWLACTAFHVVFHRRQTKYKGLLAWLRLQLETPALRAQRKLLEPVASAYR